MLEWLAALPPVMLLATMALLAAVENVFPPIPADVLVAFGGFLAARAHGSPWPSFLAIWIGNVGGALVMYGLGRRLGSSWIRRRLHLHDGSLAEQRFVAWYQRWGVIALFVSRFVPGVRSIVPPMGGALRIPLPGLALSMALASGIWYGCITYLAFSAGNNWDALSRRVGGLGLRTGLVALGVVVTLIAGLLVGVLVRRHRARRT